MTFAEFAEGFWNYDTCPIIQDKIQRGGTYSKQSSVAYQGRNESEFIPQFGKRFLPEITNSMIRDWHRNLPKRLNITPRTANDYLLPLRMMFDEAVRQNLIEHNPCIGIKPLIGEQKIRGCFTQEQIDKLFSANWESKLPELACKLTATTGMRMGEVLGLCKEQLHDGYIIVDRSYNVKEGLKQLKVERQELYPSCRNSQQN